MFTTKDTSSIPTPDEVYEGSEKDRLVDVEISEEMVKARLAALREDKSPGPDDFSPRLLKMTCEEIPHPIVLIFNRSMKEGDVPLD